jgi:uncharacterized membrane protein YozB (DUF420 family)
VIESLPAVNAAINAATTLLLLGGWLLIRRGRREAHARAMKAAFVLSAIFLVSYLTHHFARRSALRRYAGPAEFRALYYAVLASHSVLAAAVAVLVPVTMWRALRGRFDAHRKLARITFPIWLYVAVTGPVIYAMLYRL